jgi:glycosyltransferase involved in cell wall biosynthesis
MDLTQTGKFNEHTTGSHPKITVLICALNEALNLPHVLPKIPSFVDEVLLVDGHSTDATIQIAKQLCPKIRVVHQPGRGKGDALKFGVQQAVGDIIVTLDADGQNDPNEISSFVEPLLDGYEFAKGSRLAKGRPQGMAWHRWMGNKVLVMASNILHGTKYTDVCAGYNAFRKDAFSRVQLSRDGFEMEQEMNVRIKKAGLKVIEVPFKDPGRLCGDSKVPPIRQGLKDLLTIIRERFHD